MAINFPSSPSVNQTHTHSGKEWTWNGTSWVISTSASNYTLPIATAGALGGVKVGSRLTIDAVSGVLDADVQTSSFGTSDVDAHLNQSNPTSGSILQWNGSDYAWVAQSGTTTFLGLSDTPSSFSADQWVKVNASGTALEFTSAPSGGGYSNSDVDTHLNQSNPTNGYVLSWNGSDYAWVAQTTDTNTQLSTEQVQDIVGAMFSSNTETRISATYQDGDGTIDLVVDDMTANTQLTTEQVQDIVGAMFTGNTETRISATYEDSDGTIDLVVDDMNDTDTNTNDYVNSASLSGNTLTLGRTGSQSLADLTVDLSSLAGGGGASVTVSDNAPAGPSAGDLWWDSDNGRLKVYYTDATPDSQWVDASPLGSQLTVGNTSIAITDTGSNGTITFNTEGTDRWEITSTGHLLPKSHESFDIGAADAKVRHLFLSDNSLKFGTRSLGVTAGGQLQFDGKDLLQNVVLSGLDNNETIQYNGTNWVNVAFPGAFDGTLAGDLTVDTDTLKVDTAQNRVGIGTASPNSLLHLKQTSDAVYITFDSNSNVPFWLGSYGTNAGFFLEQGSTNNSLLTTDANDYVSLWGAGTKRFETDANGVLITGKVGIGGTASANLDLISANNSQDLRVYSQGLANNSKLQLRTGNNGNCFIEMGDTDDADIGGIRYCNWSNENWMGFTTNASERLRITSTGAITFDATSTGHGTSGQVLTSNGDASPSWQDAGGGGGTPGGNNTQLQINNNGAFGGCNLEYSTNLDGSLEWTDASGTSGARISCYHPTISGGDGSIIFYAGAGLLGTLNMRIFNNSVTVYGALTKGSGSFRIPHPLPALKDTKDLVHSFIEGPQCDNLYRGKVDLVGGTATVNLDTKSDMTTGTFVALNRDVQCFTTNETGWTAVKGSVSGNILTITAQDNTCTDTISWMVVGERQDDNIKSSMLTDATGKLIMEPNQIPLPPTS